MGVLLLVNPPLWTIGGERPLQRIGVLGYSGGLGGGGEAKDHEDGINREEGEAAGGGPPARNPERIVSNPRGDRWQLAVFFLSHPFGRTR